MFAKMRAIYDVILPNKRINRVILILFIIGFISGCLFLTIVNTDEKEIIISQITNFISNINNNSIDNLDLLKNSLINNYVYVIVLWILGLSILGVIINIFLVYIKGFILGFTLSSIVLTYKTKGILFSLVYVFPNELIKVLVILLLGVYSLTLSLDIVKELLKKNNNELRKVFKRYVVILCISIILMGVSSLYESYVIPDLLNFIY